jgi:two-component system, LytTR family, response regulator
MNTIHGCQRACLCRSVKAEHDYVSLYVGEKSWLVRETIASIESRFSGAGLVRIHRSTLVNIDRVRELRPLDKGNSRSFCTTARN